MISAHDCERDGTATAGADYTATAGSVTLPPGSLPDAVSVPILADVLDEHDETFAATITAELADIGDGQGVATITDDDPTTVLFTAATGEAAVRIGLELPEAWESAERPPLRTGAAYGAVLTRLSAGEGPEPGCC